MSQVFILLLCFSFSPPKAWAGVVFEFSPLFISEAMYDDNIYLTRSNTRSDWITTVSPGFMASLLHPRLNLEVEYTPGFVYFLHNPQHDYTRQEVNFNATLELTSDLTFSLYESYLRAKDLELEEMLETDYERGLRRDALFIFNRNTIAPQLEYRFGRDNFIRLYYRNTGYRSDDHFEDDYRENYVESELEYWFNDWNGINLLCGYTKGNFDLDTDILNSASITARYLRHFTPNFELYGEYGIGVTDFEERRFQVRLDERREFQADLEDAEDYDTHKFNLGFVWEPALDLRIEGSMGYFWRQGVGNRDDQGLITSLEIEKATENLTVNLNWESGYNAYYFAIRDSGFSEFWRLSTDLTYNYHEILELSCGGLYGYNEYPYGRGDLRFASEEREEYRYAANISLIYHIVRDYFFLNNLSFEIEFNHVELDSNFDSEYYINNQCTGRITATF